MSFLALVDLCGRGQMQITGVLNVIGYLWPICCLPAYIYKYKLYQQKVLNLAFFKIQFGHDSIYSQIS